MAIADVDIANAALAMLGAEPIISLQDDSEAARACNLRYEQVFRAVLRAHPWNAAKVRVALAPLTQTPVFDFSNYFQLPNDFLRMLKIDPNYLDYKIEGKLLACNSSAINILYIARVTDLTVLDPLLIETIAARLAHEIAYKITESTAKQKQMWDFYQVKLTEARGVNAQEDTPDELPDGPWIDSRFGYGTISNTNRYLELGY